MKKKKAPVKESRRQLKEPSVTSRNGGDMQRNKIEQPRWMSTLAEEHVGMFRTQKENKCGLKHKMEMENVLDLF